MLTACQVEWYTCDFLMRGICWESYHCKKWSETYRALHSPQTFSSLSYRWSRHRYKHRIGLQQRWTPPHSHNQPSATCMQDRKPQYRDKWQKLHRRKTRGTEHQFHCSFPFLIIKKTEVLFVMLYIQCCGPSVQLLPPVPIKAWDIYWTTQLDHRWPGPAECWFRVNQRRGKLSSNCHWG